MRTSLRIIILVVLAIVSPMAAHAQLVRGVLKTADSLPLAGAIVTLAAANGLPVARTYSQENGFFEVRAPSAGQYVLTIDRTGFETAIDRMVDVAGLVTNVGPLVPAAPPRTLGTGPATAMPCRMGLDLDGRDADLWDSIYQAYAALVTIEDSRKLIRFVTRYQRTLDIDGKKVLEERSVPEMRVSERSFLVPGPDSIMKVGYVHGDSTYFTFESPDARIILGTAFRAMHCFTAVPGERLVEGRAQVGLTFAPVGESRLTRIEGTFWVDRDSGQLKALEWSYVPAPATRGSFGGSQEYRVTEKSGLIYLGAWSQRLPIFVTRRTLENRAMLTDDRQLRFTPGATLDVSGIRVDAGEVTRLP